MLRIKKVTDLRTGLVHPRRDVKGRFLSRKRSAKIVWSLHVYWMEHTANANKWMAQTFIRRAA